MRSHPLLLAFALIVPAVAFGCASAGKPTSTTPTADGSATSSGGPSGGIGGGGDAAAPPGDEARAKALFEAHCGECHDLPKFADHPAEQWPHIMDEMGPKADLDAESTKLVLDWILAQRSAGA